MKKFGSSDILTVSEDLNIGGELLYGGGGYTIAGNSLLAIDKISHQLHRIDLENTTTEQITSSLISAASPRISPGGRYSLFVHSDGTTDSIYIKGLSDQNPAKTLISADPKLVSQSMVAGGEGISVQQPEFSPDGRFLAYISDQDGWWQIYLYSLDTEEHQQLTNVNAEHGLPEWVQDQQSYIFSHDSSQIFFLRNQEGIRSLWSLDLTEKEETRIRLDENYTWLEDIALAPDGERFVIVASGANLPARLITVDLEGKTNIIRHSSPVHMRKENFSIPEAISWTGQEGQEAHGLFYSPHNPLYTGEGNPPLIVIIHSGPTRQKWVDFQTRTQYFTSRGYAVLEVNYRGSTGYGREYRQALEGNWGVSDVDDCLSGAIHLADQGLVDRSKMVVMGSSSGGMTVYQILVKYPGVFKAGVALYGIVNHLSLLENPPKFERHYSDWLIGPYPEAAELYLQRSPVFFADNIQDPVAVFQGGKDRIVPQDQAEQIISALEKNQVSYLYRLYPEEGHSFKHISTLEDFYSQLEGFLNTHLNTKG